jgi:putative FmdB family regulatory protein
MPIYEFHCKECRQEFKTLRRAEQVDSVTCPTCGTGRVARLLSVTAQAKTEGDDACAMPMGGGCCMNPGGCRFQN